MRKLLLYPQKGPCPESLVPAHEQSLSCRGRSRRALASSVDEFTMNGLLGRVGGASWETGHNVLGASTLP